MSISETYNKKKTLDIIKLKYLGKLEKIISQLKENKIILEQKANEWSLKII